MLVTTFNPAVATNYTETVSKTSVVSQFLIWSDNQQANRLLWLGIALGAHGCIITPLTVVVVMLAGLNFALFMLAMTSMTAVLAVNLAAQPTKITIPIFLLSLAIDLGIIISCIVTGLNLGNTMYLL